MTGTEQSLTRYSRNHRHQFSTLTPADAYRETVVYTKAEPHAPAHRLQPRNVYTSHVCPSPACQGWGWNHFSLVWHSTLSAISQMGLKRLYILLSQSPHLKSGKAEAWGRKGDLLLGITTG